MREGRVARASSICCWRFARRSSSRLRDESCSWSHALFVFSLLARPSRLAYQTDCSPNAKRVSCPSQSNTLRAYGQSGSSGSSSVREAVREVDNGERSVLSHEGASPVGAPYFCLIAWRIGAQC